MENRTDLMRIGQLARQAGVSIRTLRYYEEIGLLQPEARTEPGYRLYGPRALSRLQTIKRLKGMGLRLAEIRRLMDTYEKSGACSPVRLEFHDLLRAHIQRIDEQIAELALLKQGLQQRLEWDERYAQGKAAAQVEQDCRAALGLAEPPILGGKAHDRKLDRS